MSDSIPPPAAPDQPDAPPPPPPPPPTTEQPYPTYAGMAAQAGITPQPYGGSPAGGPIGQVRGTGISILLYVVTVGFYGWYYFYKVHQEMKDHSGQGIGGALALVLAMLVGFVNPYIMASEVGSLSTRRGQAAPVSAKTGLWYFPGMLILVGPFIWFAKTNGALNDYWRSLGATG